MARLLLAVLLAASAAAGWADELDDIVKRGALRVGVSLFEPWTVERSGGELAGFEVDVARKVATDMGVRADLHVYEWDDIMGALEKGEIDMIAGGMAITPARALRVAFSLPYARSGVSLATNTASTRNVTGLAGLNREPIRIATVTGTLASDLASTLFDGATIERFREPTEAEQAVLAGKAQVYLATVPEVRFLALRHPDRIDVPLAEPLIATEAGLAVQRGHQGLLNFLNAWVTAHTADKWLATSYRRWFESIDWMQTGEE